MPELTPASSSESAPAPALPPVPGWERVAAGVLAAMWVVWFWVWGLGEWYRMIGVNLSNLRNHWQSFLTAPTGDVLALLNSFPLLEGLVSGLWLVAWGGVPVLIVGGLVVGSGQYLHRYRRWLWWLALGNGALCDLALLFQSRHAALTGGTPLLSRHEGWLEYFSGDALPWVGPAYWPFAAELLLAALVLGGGWWRRKRRCANVAGGPKKECTDV